MSYELVGKIKLTDNGASSTLKKIDQQMKQLSRSTETTKKAVQTYVAANGRARDEFGKFVKGANSSKKALDGLDTSAKKTLKTLSNFAKKTAMGALGVGAVATGAAAVAGYSSLKKAMNFESQMSSIQALTGATDAQMKQMQTLALQQGAATKYSALEAAQGIEELLKAGLTPATVQAGGLNAALNLATSGGLDLASAAEIMSTALNAFKSDGMSAAQASNILAGTANASATSVEELRMSLAAVSSVAAGLGLTFEDTNTALGLFANNGLKGSDAGTSLKTMLQNLQPQTKTQISLFKALGLMTKNGSNAFYDAHGNIKSLEDVSGLLRKSLSKLTNQQRSLALETMFGTDAIRAGNILYKEGAKGVKNFQKEMKKVTALDVARKKMDNASGAVEQFKGALETLQIAGMMPTLPLVKRFANAAADFVTKYTPRITASIQRMVDKAKGYLNTHFLKNPAFQNLPDLKSKVNFVIGEIGPALSAWLNSSGTQQIASFGTKLATSLAVSMGKSMATSVLNDPLLATTLGVAALLVNPTPIGLTVALSIAAPAWFKKIISDNSPVLQAKAKIERQYNSTQDLTSKVATNAKKNPNQPLVKGGYISAPDKKPWYENAWGSVTDAYGGLKNFVTSGRGYAGGLDRVPYNRFPAYLHKDEAVLTRSEANDYRNGNGSSTKGGNVIITGNTFHVRNDSDIERIAKQLAYHLAK